MRVFGNSVPFFFLFVAAGINIKRKRALCVFRIHLVKVSSSKVALGFIFLA